MSTAPSTVYRYFAVDTDLDPTADTVEIGTTQTGPWTAATWVTDSGKLTALNAQTCDPVQAGLTRHWAQLLTGPSNFPLTANSLNTVYGRVTDSPEQVYFTWKFSVSL